MKDNPFMKVTAFVGSRTKPHSRGGQIMCYCKMNFWYFALVFVFTAQIAGGQTEDMSKDLKLNTKTKTAIIESINNLIVERYVFPDVAS